MAYYSVWVGGLKGVVQERDLTEKFSPYGRVRHVFISRDQETKKSRHFGFVIFDQKQVAENAARKVSGTTIHGGEIIARGPEEQIRRGHSGEYTGKIGHVPSNDNDKRKYTDCLHYVNSVCTVGTSCPYRHSALARDPHVLVCSLWSNNNCTNVHCPHRHPGQKYHYLASGDSDPVIPLYSLSINDQGDDDTIKLACYSEFEHIKRKFKQDWAEAKGIAPDVKAVFVITNHALRRKWTVYKQSLSFLHQGVEEHYHGTKLLCNITSNEDLCCSYDCSVCRIVTSGFSSHKIGTNISRFQRFGRGFYLAPNSSKCHDYTEGAYDFRAVILCDVCPGKKYTTTTNNTSLNGPPAGYDSIHGKTGGILNYEELVLPNADSILPKYIVVYKKDGIRKLIE